MNNTKYFIIIWILFKLISVHNGVSLDLEPWLPKSSELYLDTTNQLYVVRGITVQKNSLQSKNLSLIRSLKFRSERQLYGAGSGFIEVYSSQIHTSNFDSVELFSDGAGNVHDFVFYDNSLIAAEDDGLYKYSDIDLNNRCDGEPEKLLSWKVKQGKSLSIIKSGVSKFYISGSWSSLDISNKDPIVDINGVIEFLPEFNRVTFISHGLNNPISLASNMYQDLFCFNQGAEDGFLLPQTKPNQLIHIPTIKSFDLSHISKWNGATKNPDSSPVSMILNTSSTVFRDIAEYRHYMFASSFFYGGHFAADWLNGRLLFFKLEPYGSSYSTTPYLVVKSAGLHGWAPSALTVSPDGSLIVAHSLTGSRGALYRVSPDTPDQNPDIRTEIHAALRAPQPFETWSEKSWRPLANTLENEEFLEVVVRDSSTPLEKIMAMNALASKNDMFGESLPLTIRQQISPDLLTIYLSALSGKPISALDTWFKDMLTLDLTVFSQRKILELMSFNPGLLHESLFSRFLFKSCFSTDSLISQLARKQIIEFPENLWNQTIKQNINSSNRELALILNYKATNQSDSRENLINELIQLIRSTGDLAVISECVDITGKIYNFSTENPDFRDLPDNHLNTDLIDIWHGRIKAIYPTRDGGLNEKIAVLSVQLGINNPTISNRFAANIHTKLPSDKLLYFLKILLATESDIPARFQRFFAEAILNLSKSAIVRTSIEDVASYEFVLSVLQQCFAQWPWLAEKISGIKNFPLPEDVMVLQFFPEEWIDLYLLELFNNYENEPDRLFYPALVDTLAKSSLIDKVDRILQLWKQKNLQKSITKYLSTSASGNHITYLLESLTSADQDTLIYAFQGILSIMPSQQLDPPQLAQFIRALNCVDTHLLSDLLPDLKAFFKAQVPTFSLSPEPDSISDLYQQVLSIYTRTYEFPKRFLELDPNDDPERWNKVFNSIDWTDADFDTGKALFFQRNCANCHGPHNFFGPHLSFANTDSEQKIAESIIFPHRTISPAFKTYLVHIENSQFMGFLISKGMNHALFTLNSESPLRGSIQKFKLAEPAAFSIMPGGLLDGLDAYQIASLVAYLKSLSTY